MADQSFEQVVILEVSRALEPLAEIESTLMELLSELGWRSAGGNAIIVDLGDLAGLARGLIDKGVVLAEAESDEERLAAAIDLGAEIPLLVNKLRTKMPVIKEALNSLPDLIGPATQMAEMLFLRLVDYLVYGYLVKYHPKIFSCLHLLGLAERLPDEFGTMVRTVHWQRINLLLSDPVELAEQTYSWETDFNGEELLKRVDLFMRAFMLPGGVYRQDTSVQQALGRAPGSRELRIPLYQDGRWPTSYSEVDLNLSPVPARTHDGQQLGAGLALYPSLFGVVQVEESLVGGWAIRLRGNADLSLGFAAELRPPAQVLIRTNLFEDSSIADVDARLELRIVKAAANNQLTYMFGSKDGSHLALRQAGVDLILAFERGQTELAVELMVEDLTLAISGSEGDGFIQKLLSGISIKSVNDLSVGISNLDGLYFNGSGALEITIPIHQQLGPVNLQSTSFGITFGGQDIDVTLAVTLDASIGPISASVEKIGLEIPVGFPEDSQGNLGPLQVEKPKFKPPVGAGLSLDTGLITGGGFLEIDSKNGRYAGILGLKAAEIGLTAIGLISTRMPDGSDDFSMLVSIGVVFNPGIPLPYGFELQGVGGLIGVNRDMSTVALQAGLRAKALDSILFPDPATVVENASKIISDLRSVFPPAEGRIVVGPCLKIGYGGGKISAEIGVFISLPMPISIALLGQVQAFFPKPGPEAVVELNMDILGILDLGKCMLSFQATLRDSNILKTYQLYGDSAFLLSWGDDPQFALSMGGFHPRFDPPPPPIVFFGLRRLGISMSSGSNFTMACEAYQALTPGTLQFGAAIQIYAKKSGATFKGHHAAFDTIIYFSPFSFEAAISALVAVSYKGADLADVRLSFVLTGPTPWRARGKAKIKVLCFEGEKSFNFSWGSGQSVQLPAVDPWEVALSALSENESWKSALPTGFDSRESLASDIEHDENILLAHPAGTLEVRQQALPFNKILSKIGNAPVKDHNKVVLTKIELGYLDDGVFTVDATVPVSIEETYEFFSRPQFESLNVSQSLSAPAFEKMTAGAAARILNIQGDSTMEVRSLEYESILLTEEPLDLSDGSEVHIPSRRWRERMRGSIDFDHEGQILCAGAHRTRQHAKNEAIARTPSSRVRRVKVEEESFLIVNNDDMAIAEGIHQPVNGWNRSEADRILSTLDPAIKASVQVVPSWEAGGLL